MKAIDKAKSFLKKYRHAWVLSYFLIYMPWFVYLEKRTDVRHYMIHSPIDNHIPFIEYFIIPYLFNLNSSPHPAHLKTPPFNK